MPIEADIKHFQSWALKLGCPLDCLPSQDSLKKYILIRKIQLATF